MPLESYLARRFLVLVMADVMRQDDLQHTGAFQIPAGHCVGDVILDHASDGALPLRSLVEIETEFGGNDLRQMLMFGDGLDFLSGQSAQPDAIFYGDQLGVLSDCGDRPPLWPGPGRRTLTQVRRAQTHLVRPVPPVWRTSRRQVPGPVVHSGSAPTCSASIAIN